MATEKKNIAKKVKKLRTNLKQCDSKKECRRIRRVLRKFGYGIRQQETETPRIPNLLMNRLSTLQQFYNIPKPSQLILFMIINEISRAAAIKRKASWDIVKVQAHNVLIEFVKKYSGKKAHDKLLKSCGPSLPKYLFKTGNRRVRRKKK